MTDAPRYGEDSEPRVYPSYSDEDLHGRRSVNAGRLWTGGIMAAVVGGALVATGLLHIASILPSVGRSAAELPDESRRYWR